MTKRLLGLLAIALALVLAAALLRAARLDSRQIRVAPAATIELDEAALGERLAGGIRFETVTRQDPALLPIAELQAFQAHLERSYPRMHAALTRERVLEHSLLYTWPGSDPDLEPLLLMAHQDVVPVEPGSEGDWTHPPFSGAIADGVVWGRGSLDDKGSLFALCEAVERLLADGYTPRRTLLLAFGHDEEVAGTGAEATARLLAERGIHPLLVVDEGLGVLEGVLPGIDRPVALIGIAENGYATVELSVTAEGGHSSTPPRQTAVGILAAAVARLEQQPMPGGLEGVSHELFAYLAPELPFSLRLPLANLWLFGGIVEAQLEADPSMNAMLRTTTAATMIEGSVKENVLPIRAKAAVNFRLLPGDSSEQLLAHVHRAVADQRVELRFLREPIEASPVSPLDGPGFPLLQRSIAEIFPEAVVAPGLVLGGTDSRQYTRVTPEVFRFMPFVFRPESLRLAHGTNEHIALADYARGVRWFVRLIENASAESDR
jgi:carboxypeptidase PM20D1